MKPSVHCVPVAARAGYYSPRHGKRLASPHSPQAKALPLIITPNNKVGRMP